MAPVEY